MSSTAAPLFAQAPAHAPARALAHKRGGSRLMARIAQRIGAVSLALVAVFVWLAPGESWDGEMMLYKLLVCAAAALGSAALWQMSAPPVAPTVEVDVAAGELRLIREGAERRVLERCAFCDLHLVELSGRRFTFWGRGNTLLAEFSLSNAAVHARLLGALRAAGKLV